MEGKTDLRVIKTKKALTESMMEILCKKRLEDITVQEICDNAMVRRATFYTHFADKYELLSYAIRVRYKASLFFQRPSSSDSTEDIYKHLVGDAINFLVDNMVIFHSILSSQIHETVLNLVRGELEQDLLPLIEESIRTHDINSRSPRFVFNFYLHGIFGSFLWWVREDYPITKEELIVQIQSMLHLS